MSAIGNILRNTISELLKNISDNGFLNHIICEMTNFIENEKFYSTQKFQEQYVSASFNQNIEENSAQPKVEEPEIKVDVNKAPTYSEILKKDSPISPISSQSVVSSNSVTSTNSSRNSGQQYSIGGIVLFEEEIIEKMKHNPEMNKNIDEITIKNKKIYNIDTLIKSLLDAGIPMWKIMFYFYISNKEYDISASSSSEDARQNDKKFQILEDYSKNKLINFDDNHPFYEYIKYYFDKTIEYNSNNDFFTCKKDKGGNPIVLIFKNRFVKLIKKSMTHN